MFFTSRIHHTSTALYGTGQFTHITGSVRGRKTEKKKRNSRAPKTRLPSSCRSNSKFNIVVGPMARPEARGLGPGPGLKWDNCVAGLDILFAGRAGPGAHNLICGPDPGRVCTTAAGPDLGLKSYLRKKCNMLTILNANE